MFKWKISRYENNNQMDTCYHIISTTSNFDEKYSERMVKIGQRGANPGMCPVW